jgi:nucleotidyltransferase substrate binding protein (TIGR01987 family)
MANLELENFRKTLTQLKLYLDTPIVDDRDRAGIIQAFEFTFEQSWKAIQKIAGRVGSEVGHPKQAYTLAMQSGWIDRKDEIYWLQLLSDRNLTSHTYREALASEILQRIQNQYVSMFEGLLQSLSGI